MKLNKVTIEYDHGFCVLHSEQDDMIILSKTDVFKLIKYIEDAGIHNNQWRTATQQLLIDAYNNSDDYRENIEQSNIGLCVK